MNPLKHKMLSALKYPGGKSYLCRRIIGLMRPHGVYAESHFGGGSVFLNKPPADRTYINDVDVSLVDFWRAFRSEPRLLDMISRTEYDAATFRLATIDHADPDPAFSAWRYLVRNRMSRGGLGRDFAESDRLRGKRRPDGPIMGDAAAWDSFRDRAPVMAARFKHAMIDDSGAVEFLDYVDGFDTLAYVDPPYMLETRTALAVYRCEMTASGSVDEDRARHRFLLDALLDFRGQVLLSGYRSPLYDGMLAGWTRHDFEMPNHSGQGKVKQRRIESVWDNLKGG